MKSARRPFLTAAWRNLLMVSFAVPPESLEPLVPMGTELDIHDDNAYVSLVAFQFLDTRVRGMRIPFHHQFEELNLRFYVRRRVGDEFRRGVVFVREVVPRRAIATAARLLYREPYMALPMRHQVLENPVRVFYQWQQGGVWERLGAEAKSEATIPPPTDHRAFITEHYWGYTRRRDGITWEYEVTHPRWRIWNAELICLPDFSQLLGRLWGKVLKEPASTLIAEGSTVAVYPARRF